ncbi:hypothetical protein SVIOM74S_03795 [Streptomyces violarus]
MKTGTFSPLTGLVAYAPVKTPVLSLASACRSTSDLAAACLRYAVTASAGLAWPPVHTGWVPSGQAAGMIRSTMSCSGASTMNVAPNRVSWRVVKTVMPPAVSTGKSTRAPSERPIQLRCCSLMASGQSSASRSFSSRSA